MMMEQGPVAEFSLAIANIESGLWVVEADFQMFLKTFDIILGLIAFNTAQVFGTDSEATALRGHAID